MLWQECSLQERLEGECSLQERLEGECSLQERLEGECSLWPRRAPGLFIGPLAHKLGVEPATLRKWERAGLVRPDRDRKTGYRVYAESAVRDAQLIRQLRRGGFALSRIAPLIAHVRSAGGVEPLVDLIDDWRDRIHARGRAMLSGAAELDRYLVLRNPDGRARPELPDAPPSVPAHR